MNATAGKVFGGISDDQLKAQAVLLQSISPADIHNLAERHDMAHVAPVLIARRKSILDQLHIVDPPPTMPDPDPTPATVKVPTVAVPQVGKPPAVAVHNWNVTLNALPDQVVDDVDWDHDHIKDVVWKKDDDLWVLDGDLAETSSMDHRGFFRNVFTDEVKSLTIYSGQDSYLKGSDKDNVDGLADVMRPGSRRCHR